MVWALACLQIVGDTRTFSLEAEKNDIAEAWVAQIQVAMKVWLSHQG